MPAPQPRTIQIFLPDGDPRSVRIADITSRTVQAVQVPRGAIDRAAGRTELKQVGVYLLFGEAEEGDLPPVYVGESEDCLLRLRQHDKDATKDYWRQSVVVTSKTKSFDKAQGRWLEWYCTQRAAAAKRYRVQNQAAANEPHVSEPVRADLVDHFETLRTLVGTLGFPVFLAPAEPGPVVEAEPDGPDSKPSETNYGAPDDTLRASHPKGGDARGRTTPEGFAVFQGSEVRSSPVPSLPESSRRIRERLIENGVLQDQGGALRFTQDYVFSSPSAAASVVLGRSANGLVEWSDAAGRTLKDRFESPGS